MAHRFPLDIVTPFGNVFSEPVEHLRVPGVDGTLGILAGHTPLLTTLKVGLVEVRQFGETRTLAVSGGFIEVMPYQTTILAEAAEFAEDIDVLRASAAKQRAEERLRRHEANLDEARALAALARAMNRIRIAEHLHRELLVRKAPVKPLREDAKEQLP